METQELQSYLNKSFQGRESFLETVLYPIFGEDNFVDAWDIDVLEDEDLAGMARRTGIKSAIKYGTFELPLNPIDIFEVTVSDRVQMQRNRVNIQQLVRRIMNTYSSAFIIFHYVNSDLWDWRFSFCQKDDKNLTEAKRYTFLLGPGQSCRTAAQNFNKLFAQKGNVSRDDIVKAFDVEALSKEFFEKYKAHYEAFCQFAYNNRNNRRYFGEEFGKWEDKTIRDYVKKLLGRIVFLHFLQKKGWMGVPADKEWGEGDMNFMRQLFLNSTKAQKENYLDEVLEPLFSDALDKDRSASGDIFDTKVEGYRNVKIPYLNGGLFERDHLDEPASRFPAELFDRLFEFFYQYNFTIDENDPNDAQVGVDPEMLGRIFENLLEDNKDKGAFYTPKEIVQYMCRESLIAYLQTDIKTEKKRKAIRDFVTTYNVQVLNDGMADMIDDKLKEVKICDPAIGSGAFPMGLLKELFYCRGAIEAFDNAAEIKRHIIEKNIYGVDIERGAVDIARLRFWLALVVDTETPQVLPNMDFKIMQGNSLLEQYEGVDLSKLVSNGLTVGTYSFQRDLFGSIEDSETELSFAKADSFEQFQSNIKAMYSTTDHQEKQRILKEVEEYILDNIAFNVDLRRETMQLKLNGIVGSEKITTELQKTVDKMQGEIDRLTEIIKKVKELKVPNSDFFLWHTYFKDVFDKGGFDIVIGNPPYIKEYNNKEAFNGFRESSPYYIGKMDLWHGFACHCIDLLKHNGILAFIAQNNWTTSSGAKLMRNKITQDTRILQLLDFNEYMVFEESASIQTMIMLFSNDNISDNYKIDVRKLNSGATKSDMLNMLHGISTNMVEYSTPVFNRHLYVGKFILFESNDIFGKIENGKQFLNKNEIAQGIVFPQDFLNKKAVETLNNSAHYVGEGVFGLNAHELETMNLGDENKLIRPYYTSSEIHRYYTDIENKLWMIYTDSHYSNPHSLDRYPIIKAHLDRFQSIITSSSKPYGLHRSRNPRFFNGEKIIAQRKCVGRPLFSYNDFPCYVTQTYNVIKTDRWNLKFLTGLLNSKLIAHWLKNKGKMQGENFQVDKEPILQIPIPLIDNDNTQRIIENVGTIVTAKQQNPQSDTTALEREIDSLVYELYGLTNGEVKIIDAEAEVSGNDNDLFKV